MRGAAQAGKIIANIATMVQNRALTNETCACSFVGIIHKCTAVFVFSLAFKLPGIRCVFLECKPKQRNLLTRHRVKESRDDTIHEPTLLKLVYSYHLNHCRHDATTVYHSLTIYHSCIHYQLWFIWTYIHSFFFLNHFF